MTIEVQKSTLGEDLKEYKVILKQQIFNQSDLFLALLTPGTLALQYLITGTNWIDLWILLTILLALWRIHAKINTVVEESMLVMQDLGVLMTTRFITGKETHTFIDRSKITSVVINEGITMYNVIYYMAFMVQDKDKLVLAFRQLIPRYPQLLDVYHDTKRVLFGKFQQEM